MLEDQYESDTLIDVIAQGWSPTRVAEYCDVPIREVKAFYKRHKNEIQERRESLHENEEEITESEEGTEEERIDTLWISSKFKRLQRYQKIAEKLYTDAMNGQLDATTLRELRSFMMYVANELGQIPNRGSAASNLAGETASYEIVGVDMDALS